MVPVGVIGLSSDWESRYRPALKSLRNRIVVRGVYDPVLSRAEHAAGELGTVAASGMQSLARRDDLKALLIFDTGWYGPEALRILCKAGRPMVINGRFSPSDATLDRLILAADDCGTMVMPALESRYTPATFRLRELMATRLGRPVQIDVFAELPADPPNGNGSNSRHPADCLACLVDWCCYVVPTSPIQVQVTGSAADTIRLSFGQPRSGGASPVAEIRTQTTSGCGASVSTPRYRVRCERGEATLDADDRIVWQTADERGDESLVADRSAVQVMLDHFCRRVVGGLIPIAGLEDVRRGRSLVYAAFESRRTGAPIAFEARG